MSSRLADIAEAIKDELVSPSNQTTWGAAFGVERTWNPIKKMDKITALTALVVPDKRTSQPINRIDFRSLNMVYVVFVAPAAKATNEVIDAYDSLVEKVYKHFEDRHRLISNAAGDAFVFEVENDPACSRDDLASSNMFVSQIVLTIEDLPP